MKSKVLQAIIQNGPITAKKITDICEIDAEGDRAHRFVRTIILDLTKEGWPIAGGNNGFFIAHTRKQRRRYRRRLRKYLRGIQKRMNEFEDAWTKFKNDENYYVNILRHYRRPKRKIKRRKL